MNRVYILLLAFCFGNAVHAQKRSDTTALIKDFNRVMSFAVQPYLSYSSVTSMRISPAAPAADSGNILHTSFYKLNDDLYYGNEQEEVYLQDSLVIRINHPRKMIQVSKLDVASKENMDLLPLKKMDIQKMLRENYSISRVQGDGDTERIIIRSQEKRTAQGTSTEEMLLTYTKGAYLPSLMEITMQMKQPASDQVVSILARQGFDAQKMVQGKDGNRYIVMSQTASINFISIDATKDKAMRMPLWKEKVGYDDAQKIFSGKGVCEGYEITKTF